MAQSTFRSGLCCCTSTRKYSIGGFEAHGLALIAGGALYRAVDVVPRRFLHALALAVHLLLGGANLLFWSSFVQMDLVPMGIVTTVLHALFVALHAACLRQFARE